MLRGIRGEIVASVGSPLLSHSRVTAMCGCGGEVRMKWAGLKKNAHCMCRKTIYLRLLSSMSSTVLFTVS